MRALAVDPGSIKTGFAVLEYRSGKTIYITSGTIFLERDKKLPDRLCNLAEDLRVLCQKYKPQHLALESVFFAKNAQSALKLGHARGVVLLTGASFNMEIFEYSPTEVKSSVCGSGRADKAQIEHMTRLLLKLPSNFQFSSSDHSDALAIGLTHLQTWESRRRTSHDCTAAWTTRTQKPHPVRD